MDEETEQGLRYARQNRILELIERYDIETQDALADHLRSSGFKVTQATISRDIKELQLVKTLAASGRHKYTAAPSAVKPVPERFVKIFGDTVQSVAAADNLIVIKTLSGCANAACESIDAIGFPHVLGTIAGDNTIFLVCDERGNVSALVEQFESLMR
jgi:transcriptional regulator of arginine metabolism